MTKPTPEQRAFLEDCGVQVPRTKISCSRLISYIKDGNRTVGDTKEERIQITKSHEDTWVGKRVCFPHIPEIEGTVIYLLARTAKDVVEIRRAQRIFDNKELKDPAPFKLHVAWEGKPAQSVAIGMIKVCD